MKFDTVKSLVLLAGAGFIGWKVYQVNKAAGKAVDAVSDTASDVNNARISLGKKIGLGIYRIFN